MAHAGYNLLGNIENLINIIRPLQASFFFWVEQEVLILIEK